MVNSEEKCTRSSLLGRYEIGRTLGEGNFGKVKYARHIATGANLAVKILDRKKILSLRCDHQIFKGDMQIPMWLSPAAKDLLRKILEPNPMKRINISGIKEHEWFRKNYIPAVPYDDDEDLILDPVLSKKEQIDEAGQEKPTHINAFQLIGMASSLDLSGFFEEEDVSQRKIRFTSIHSPKDLFDKIENAVTMMGFQAQRGHSKLKVMKCKNSKNATNPSSFLACAEVFELGPSLYVVELKKSHGDPILYRELCEKLYDELAVCKMEHMTESLDSDLASFDGGSPLSGF